MYLPAYFNETRIDVLRALMRARPLCGLVTMTSTGLIANHVPVQTLDEPAPLGCIRGHIARANPLWREYRSDTEALAIFQGPQVYISPSFYPSKAKTGEVVPTWDYAVVHARGSLRFNEEATWLRELVGALTVEHELARARPWNVEDAPADYVEKMLRAIVGFEFAITALSGKWKVSQNRSHADKHGVIEHLQSAGDADALQIADMLAARDSPKPPSAR